MDFVELQQQFEFDVYPKRDVVLVRGKGSRVWDDTGREYIDCSAGHGVASLGHCNEQVVAAICKQAATLVTCPGTYYNDRKAEVLQKLAAITPDGLNRSFLCNSGTEAIEAALKFARFTTGKTDFVCANRSFHGRTMGALSATFNPEYRAPFEPLVPGFSFVPFNNAEKLAGALTDKTAAVILEAVQGEGGVHPADREYMGQVRRICDDAGALFICDEIQSGFCRTGKMFACMHFDAAPDMMCVAKAIAGGLPMGAVVCSDHIEVPKGKHGSTFGGNALCCAAACASIDYMLEHKLDVQAAEKGAYLTAAIRKVEPAVIREVRGLGLMIGVELRTRAKPYILELIERGVITLPTGTTVIRLLPPLTIGYDELDVVAKSLIEVLGMEFN